MTEATPRLSGLPLTVFRLVVLGVAVLNSWLAVAIAFFREGAITDDPGDLGLPLAVLTISGFAASVIASGVAAALVLLVGAGARRTPWRWRWPRRRSQPSRSSTSSRRGPMIGVTCGRHCGCSRATCGGSSSWWPPPAYSGFDHRTDGRDHRTDVVPLSINYPSKGNGRGGEVHPFPRRQEPDAAVASGELMDNGTWSDDRSDDRCADGHDQSPPALTIDAG